MQTPKLTGFIRVILFLMLGIPLIAATQTRVKRTRGGHEIKLATAQVEQTLKDLEQAWNEAITNRDEDALNRLLDERFIFTDNDGQVLTKARYIGAVMRAI